MQLSFLLAEWQRVDDDVADVADVADAADVVEGADDDVADVANDNLVDAADVVDVVEGADDDVADADVAEAEKENSVEEILGKITFLRNWLYKSNFQSFLSRPKKSWLSHRLKMHCNIETRKSPKVFQCIN